MFRYRTSEIVRRPVGLGRDRPVPGLPPYPPDCAGLGTDRRKVQDPDIGILFRASADLLVLCCEALSMIIMTFPRLWRAGSVPDEVCTVGAVVCAHRSRTAVRNEAVCDILSRQPDPSTRTLGYGLPELCTAAAAVHTAISRRPGRALGASGNPHRAGDRGTDSA